MKLFPPKAPPPIPADAVVHFHFPEERRPDVPVPALNDALAAVRAELARLRAVVAAGNGARPLGVLDAAVAEARDAHHIAGIAHERSQRQLAAGVIEEAEAVEIQARGGATHARLIAVGAERQRRVAADAAAADIHRIHEATA